MTILVNIIFVVLAAFFGLCFGAIAKEKGVYAGAAIFGVIALIYVSKTRVSYRPDPEYPNIYIKRESFAANNEIACHWRAYDTDGKEPLSGWCAKDKDGKWYLAVTTKEDF